MENQKVKKINVPYLLCLIFLPIVVCGLCLLISVLAFDGKGTAGALLIVVPMLAAFAWWIFAGRAIYSSRKKKMFKELDHTGFIRNNTFNGRSCTVVVDEEQGRLALQFFWNPSQYYVLPASRISKAWVDDGKSGAGVLAGSSRVSFLFIVDGIKVRVNTFTSNQRWRMDSDYILTGISKADLMVQVLMNAKIQVQ